MKPNSVLRCIMVVACLAAASSISIGQTNSIQVFGPTFVRLSNNGTGYGENAFTFNSSTVQLSCVNSPIVATISSTADGTGNVIVDNYINLTVTAGDSSTGPVNVCKGGLMENFAVDCFTAGYQKLAASGTINGVDPDTLTAIGGVPPIDISGSLQSGAVAAKIDLVDTGGVLASSSLYLNTNCSQAGVNGPAVITGNAISSTNPTLQELTQTFPFDSSPNQVLHFTYDLSQAQNAGELSITNNTIPNVADSPLDPATFIPVWVPGTSFATSSCLVHTGELLPSGAPACKLYTLQCQIGPAPNQSGGQCPISQIPNEIFKELFDGPAFTLPDIPTPDGPTFHQGVGFLMASEGWTGGPCAFDPTTDFKTLLCPQNTLVTFAGPGGYTSTSTAKHPNSSFITVAPVPEDLTTVTVAGQQPGGWINSQTASVTLSSEPPMIAGVQPPLPGQANFVPSPIQSITYGISPAANPPVPGPEPVPGDVTLTNSIACPTSGPPPQPVAATFTPPPQSVPIPNGDGMYLLHYFAQDCASTRELKFTQDESGNWSTGFYTVPINVDTTAPVVATGPILSPPPSANFGVANSYVLNQAVKANYSCTDSLSGVVRCGTSTFPAGTLNTGNIMAPVDTSSIGVKTFTVNATDAAGNAAVPISVRYQVVAPLPPVDLAVLKLAPGSVRHNEVFTYAIASANFGRHAATDVVISDTLPAGVTFVGVSAQLFSCGARGCSYTTEGTHCSYASNTVTCTLDSLGTTSWFSIAEFGVQITVRASAAAGSSISNTATISSDNPETHPGNKQSTATTRVVK